MAEASQHVDLLIAIPTYNSATTIEPVTRAMVTGLTKYFPEASAVMLNADCGSHDGTTETWERLLKEVSAQKVTAESAVMRIFMDMRAFRIYDGPSEVHRWSLARKIVQNGQERIGGVA